MVRSMTTTTMRWCWCCLLMLAVLGGDFAVTHYTDDSDYNDFDDYKDLPEKPAVYPAGDPLQDDFYMVSEEAEDRNRRVATSGGSVEDEKVVRGAACAGKEEDRDAPPPQGKWPTAERVYRYTKHRIPGYDYDELDFLEARKYHRCDDRSVWTHCLCQFTCREPNIVDCYTPCTSGCECREDYVYDPRAKQCVYPDQCQPEADYLLY